MAPPFESEVVTSCHSEGKKVCDVVNHDLRRVDAFDQYHASSIWPYAWNTGPQSPALRNVLMLNTEPKGNQGSTAKLLTDPKGALILRIAQEGECDAEVAYTTRSPRGLAAPSWDDVFCKEYDWWSPC